MSGTTAWVNLAVFDANGAVHGRTSVHLVQGDEPAPDSAFCGWMPFQKGQAAKQDAQQAKEANGGPRMLRTHRDELEQSAAHAIATRVAELGSNGTRIGREVRQALDALTSDGVEAPANQVIALPVRDLITTAEQPACRPTKFDFGGAIRHLKAGGRVARAGWNGKGMWIALSCDGSREVPAANFWTPATREWAERQPNGTAMVLPSITMKTATGEILMGWLASQTDMLAEDWMVLA